MSKDVPAIVKTGRCLEMPAHFPGIIPYDLFILNSTVLNRKCRINTDVMIAVCKWEPHHILNLFRFLEARGCGHILLSLYRKGDGKYLCDRKFRDGPLNVPASFEHDDGSCTEILSGDDVSYKIYMDLDAPVELTISHGLHHV